MELPKTMRAWQYGAVKNGIENSIKINQSASIPTPKADQHLVRIHYVALNPVDVKPAEAPLIRRFMAPNPATPGVDFSGVMVKPAKGSAFKPGDKVFGVGPSPFAGGCLADYAVAGTDSVVAVPKGLSLEHASTIGVAGLTAYQTIVPHRPKNVFLNGGSGGVGLFGIQIARVIGSDVTVTCSARNIELCKSYGASDVVDYTKGSVPDALTGRKFDLIVDNAMSDINIYWQAHNYSVPSAKYIVVAGTPSLNFMLQNLKMKLWPGFLGGGKRKVEGFFAKPVIAELEQISNWMVEGKVKAVVDSKFAFEDAPEAFRKLKTNRARGKIVVEVNGKGDA